MHDDDIQDRPEPRDRPRRRDRDDDYDDDDRPRRRRNRDDDYDDDDIRLDAPFPGTVLTAGIIWILMGSLILIGAAMIIFAALMVSSAGAGGLGGAVACGGIIAGLFGAAFLFVGVQSVRGTAADTLGNSIGSLIFAALVCGMALVNLNAGNAVNGITGFLEGAGLILAGVLGLVGRSDYAMWKRVQRRRR